VTARELAELVEAVPDAGVVTNRSGVIIAANMRCRDVFGYDAGFLVGRRLDILIPDHLRDRHRDNVARYLQEPTSRPMGRRLSLTARRADGSDVPVDVSLNPMTTVGGGVVVIAGIRDVSDRVRAASELRESEEQLRLLVDDLRLVAVSLDPAGTIRYCNRYLAELTGYGVDELVGRNWADRLSSPSAAGDNRLETAGEDGFVSEFESSIRTRNGDVRLIAWSRTPHLDDRGRVITVTGIGEDVTAERRLEQEQQELIRRLRSVSAERANLLTRLTNAEERERRRIAQDLHDDTIQWLTGANMLVGALPVRPKGRVKAREISVILSSVIDKLRRLSFDLHPATLAHAGLVSSINRLLFDLAGGTGIEVAFTSERYDGEIDPPQAACLYRICQEAIANVRKHSGATRVESELFTEDGDVVLVIADNGAGANELVPSNGHLGLLTMRERAEIAGGTLEVTAPAAGGVTVRCRLPRQAQALPTDPAAA
jgi:PAS domain S-box-containing protein